MADRLEEFFTVLADRLGAPALDPSEIDAILDLARIVAHQEERRFAPLAAYLCGLATGAAGDADRAGRVRAAMDAVRELAAPERG